MEWNIWIKALKCDPKAEQLFVLADLHGICHELSYFPLRVKSCVLTSVRSDSLTVSQVEAVFILLHTFEELRWVSGVLPGSLIWETWPEKMSSADLSSVNCLNNKPGAETCQSQTDPPTSKTLRWRKHFTRSVMSQLYAQLLYCLISLNIMVTSPSAYTALWWHICALHTVWCPDTCHLIRFFCFDFFSLTESK